MKTMLKNGLVVAISAISLSATAQKKVQSFTSESNINAPADKVWAVVGEDFGGIANSHPKIVSSNYIQGTLKSGEGAERLCNFNEKGTKYLKEKQVGFDAKNYTVKVQVFHTNGIPMEPEYTFAVYKVVPIDAGSCKFVMEMNYRTKPGFMGGIVKGKIKKTIADYALAIEYHVLTGENVNKDNFKALRKKRNS